MFEIFSNIWHWIQKDFPIVLSAILVIITYCYLRETKKQRLLMQKAMSIDISPRVFIKNMKAEDRPNVADNAIDIRTCIVIKNCGKTEAKNVRLPYTIKYKEKEIEGVKGPFQYLFPEQESSYYTKFFSIPLSPEQNPLLKKAAESGKKLNLSDFKEMFRPFRLDIKVEYEDLDGNTFSTPYSYQFSAQHKIWVYTGMGIK